MGEEEESDDNNLSLEDLMEAAKMSLSSKVVQELGLLL